MKPFFILAHHTDRHASYVAWAMETLGYRTTLINSSHESCPTRTTLTFDSFGETIVGADWTHAPAIWCRRLFPQLPLNSINADEDAFARREEQLFTRWVVAMEENCSSRWINRPSAVQAAENKFLQLKFAKLHGIAIPRTLVTAQPDRFRTFLKREGSLVAKPLEAYSWEDESGQTFSAFAAVLDKHRGSQLSDDDIARCVTIYQQRIEKTFDVRAIVMGKDIFAFKIIQDGEQHFDFRLGFYQKGHLRYEPISLPVKVKAKMFKLMDSLRVNFASADFALTADGQFVFLDLNPSGQWSFLEEGCPEAALGQKFCSFFVEGHVAPEAVKQFNSFSDYLEAAAAAEGPGYSCMNPDE